VHRLAGGIQVPGLDAGTRQDGEDQTGQSAAAGRRLTAGHWPREAVAVGERDGGPAIVVLGRPQDRRVSVQFDDEITDPAQPSDETGGLTGGDAVPVRHGTARRVGALPAGRWEECHRTGTRPVAEAVGWFCGMDVQATSAGLTLTPRDD
jgi:hypothetical protein